MKLNEFASPLVAEDNYIKASIGGFQGSGKSRTGSELIIGCYKDFQIKKPLLLIDNEKGGRFLIPLFQKNSIEVFAKQTVYIKDVLEAFELLNRGEIGFLFIDSLTKVWYQYVRDYKTKNRITFMTLQDWGKILPAWQEEFSDRYVELRGSCIFTGRGGYQYTKEEDEVDEQGHLKKKGQFVRTGTKMKMAGETPFEPDLNIWMEFQQDMDSQGNITSYVEAQILKDRSDTISWKTFKNPTYQNFKPVIDYLLNVPTGKVSKASDKTNIAPAENYAKYDERADKERLLDNIKSTFDKCELGVSVKDKAMKVKIAEKFWQAKSWTALEQMRQSEIHNGYTLFEKFMKDWATYEDKESALNDFPLEDIDPNDPLNLNKE